MAFCDFCPCGNCQHGSPWTRHAPTDDGRWICDVCWTYDVCISVRTPNHSTSGPCEHADGSPIDDCQHRPKLVGEFRKLTTDELAALEASGINHYADVG